MKRIMLQLCAVLLIFMLVSCGTGNANSETTASAETTGSPSGTVGGAGDDEAADFDGRALWNTAAEESVFENVTVTVTTVGESEGTITVPYYIDGENAAYGTDKKAIDPSAAQNAIGVYTAILAFYDQFRYNEEIGAYESIDEIEYGVTVEGQVSIIKVWDATVRFNSSARLTEIVCKMHRTSAGEGGESIEIEVEISAVFSNYGTTEVYTDAVTP